MLTLSVPRFLALARRGLLCTRQKVSTASCSTLCRTRRSSWGRVGGTEAGCGEQCSRDHKHESALVELCTPILIRDLQADCKHEGAVLIGKLVTEALQLRSVYSVLEDEAGDVVTVHVFNAFKLPDLFITPEDQKRAQAAFPKGQRLAVINPWYKLMMDGTYGIRVDDPSEVVLLGEDGQKLHSAADTGPTVANSPAAKAEATAAAAAAAAAPRTLGSTAAVNGPVMKPHSPSRHQGPHRPNKGSKGNKKRGR